MTPFGDTQAIAIGIRELHLTPPGLVVNFFAELARYLIDVVNPEVRQRARPCIALVFREMKLDAFSVEEDIQRKAGLETVLADNLEAKAAVPTGRSCRVLSTKDRNQLLRHIAESRLVVRTASWLIDCSASRKVEGGVPRCGDEQRRHPVLLG